MFSYAAFADYILMNPSAEYEEIMARVHEKIYLSKASYLVVPHTLTTHRIPHTVYYILCTKNTAGNNVSKSFISKFWQVVN